MTQVAMAAAVGGLVANASFSHPAVWPLFVCTGVGAGTPGGRLAGPPGRPAHAGGRGGRDAAIALQTTIQQLALVAGPALAGVLIATIGLGAVYGIDVATYAVALVAALLLPTLVPSGGGTPMGLRSMTEGFRHLRGQKLLSATYWIDLNAMIFGMPRAVFPALGTGAVRRRRRRGRPALRRPRGRLVGGFAVHRVVRPGPSPGPGHRRLRDHLGRDHRTVRRHPGAVDRSGACWRWPERPMSSRPCSARRSSSGPCPSTCRDGCRARSSPWWPAVPAWVTPRPGWPRPSAAPVRRVVGRAGLRGRGGRPAVAGPRALAGRRGWHSPFGRGGGRGRRRGHHRAGRGRAALTGTDDPRPGRDGDRLTPEVEHLLRLWYVNWSRDSGSAGRRPVPRRPTAVRSPPAPPRPPIPRRTAPAPAHTTRTPCPDPPNGPATGPPSSS